MFVDVPVKPIDMQAAMKTHLSQPTGDGAFDGQHGMSFAISSVVADGDISSAVACIGTSEGVSAMTGRERGANARPAITRIASSRRMAKVRFTEFVSHSLASPKSPPLLAYHSFHLASVDRYQSRQRAFQSNLPVRSTYHRHQFRYLFPLIGLVTAGDRVFDAMRHVVPQHFLLDAPQRGAHGRDLRDDIDAVAILVNHFGQTADLAFDTAEAFLAGCLDVFSHAAIYPYWV
jgi:hypothetical protein